MWRTIQAVPHYDELRAAVFWPGYYEFTLIRETEGAPLEPIFLEYSDNPAYQLASSRLIQEY